MQVLMGTHEYFFQIFKHFCQSVRFIWSVFRKKIWNLKGDRPAWEHFDGSSGKNQKNQKKSDFECQPPVLSGVKNFFFASPLIHSLNMPRIYNYKAFALYSERGKKRQKSGALSQPNNAAFAQRRRPPTG